MIGIVAVEHILIDQRRRTGSTRHHFLFRMLLVAKVRVGVVVKAQMRTRYHPKRSRFWREVLEVIKDANQFRAALLWAKDPSSPRLTVAVKADTGMFRIRAVVLLGQVHELITQFLEELGLRRMGVQLGDVAYRA